MNPSVALRAEETRTMPHFQMNEELTVLLNNWKVATKNPKVSERLFETIYRELIKIARPLIAREHHVTLVTCDLVHEAWMVFYRKGRLTLEDRSHFYGLIARLMRQILIQRSRKRVAAKRGGGKAVTLNEMTVALADNRQVSVEALEEAMKELETIDPRKARIIELRFYVGLNQEECAQVLGLSPITIQRDWRLAKQWIRDKLEIP